MIDTVKIKVGIRGLTYILPYIRGLKVEKEYTQEAVNVEGLIKRNIKTNKEKFTDKHYLSGRFMNGSRNYGIRFFINELEKSIVLEWSIPKFVFGTNLMEFIDTTDIFDVQFHSQLKKVREMFMHHIISVLDSISFNSSAKWLHDVELTRIDFCKNIIFQHQIDSDNYFKFLRETKKRYANDLEGNLNFYKDETIFYKQDNYSIKFYKKGKELTCENFTFNMKKNQAIKEIADRTIRFEITYRNAKISQILRRYYIDEKPEYIPIDDWKNKVYKLKFTEVIDSSKNIYDDFDIIATHFFAEFERWIPTDKFEKGEYIDKIKWYENTMRLQGKKVKLGRLLLICNLIATGKTWDMLCSDGTIPKSSKYYYMKLFKKIGLDISRLTFHEIIVDKTYQNYLIEFRKNLN